MVVRRREAVEKEERGIPSMVAKRMMGYRGSRRRGARSKREQQGELRGWDEEFSLAFASMSLYARLLYGCGTYICLARARRAAKKSDRV